MNGILILTGDDWMNDALTELIKLRDKIKYDGWIVIPPSPRQPNNRELEVRVEWFIAGKKYCFQYAFREIEFTANICLVDYFIEMANREIESIIRQ